MPVTRRAFALAAAGLLLPRLAPADEKPPVTGTADERLAPFDDLLTTFVQENKVPGAALAVTRGGKLLYARGFGYADPDKKTPVQPASLFRIASVSKPITAVAVMQLVERKKFKLDDKVTELMGLKAVVPPGGKVDERWQKITVRQCLQHTGGWDRGKSFDPIGRPGIIAKAVGSGPPVPPADVVRYMMGQPLDFDPGERAAYSNLGFLILGRIIAATTGMGYEEYVRKEVFGKLGVTTAQLGKALPEKRAKDEVRYFDSKKRTGVCLYPPRQGETVPTPDGAANFEGYEAHGGWIASAVDLVRFASAFDDPTKCPLLSAASITDMWARPAGKPGTDADGKPTATYMGCGWSVRPVGGNRLNAWHGGYISGTEALMVRRWDGLTWAVLFNTNDTPAGQRLSGLIDPKLHAAAGAVKAWPDKDQFPTLLK